MYNELQNILVDVNRINHKNKLSVLNLNLTKREYLRGSHAFL